MVFGRNPDSLWEGLFPTLMQQPGLRPLSRKAPFFGVIPRRGGSCLSSNGLQEAAAGRQAISTALITSLFRQRVGFHGDNLSPKRRSGLAEVSLHASEQG